VILSVLTAVALKFQKRAEIRNSLNYLTRINLHKDGKLIDLTLRNGNGVRVLENVAVEKFKLAKTFEENAFSKARLGTNDAYFAYLGQEEVLVPFKHEGHLEVLNRLF